jgi:MoaA/NifB/PqqE/SkfB family radical SAM enzyme
MLELKLGYACNNNCVFCLNKEKRYYKKFPVKFLKNKINISAQQGCERLILSGGEPLISLHLFDLISFAKSRGYKKLEIHTNGRMLSYEDFVKKLLTFSPIGFLVSFHFPTPLLYMKYSQVDGFDQTINGIKKLVKYRCGFTVNTVLMKPNLPYLKEIVDLLRNLKAKSIQYTFIDGHNILPEYKKFVPRYSQVVKILEKIIKQNPDFQIKIRDIPTCILKKQLINHLAPIHFSERINLTIGKRFFTSEGIREMQSVYPNCEGCVYRSNCFGIKKAYFQIYGSDELKPVKRMWKE